MIRTRKDKSYDEQTDLDQNIDTRRELQTVTNPILPLRKKIKIESTTSEDIATSEDITTKNDKTSATNTPLPSSCASIGTEKPTAEIKTSSEEAFHEVENFEVKTGFHEKKDEKVESVKLDKSDYNDATKISNNECSKVDDVLEKKDVCNENKSNVVDDDDVKSKEKEKHQEEEEESYTSLDIGEKYHDPTCTECKRAWKVPKKSELVMYLHAHAYKVCVYFFNCVILKVQ